jgi:tetratricopeptide (TPR) repeat protein
MQTEAKKQRRGRLVRWLAALILVAGVVAGVGWWLWPGQPVPPPPEVPLEGVEPRVAQLIRDESEAVRRAPRSGISWGRLGQVLRAHGFDEQAVACWVQAERFDTLEPRWPYYRGVVLLMQGDNRGLDSLRRAATLADRFDPTNPGPRLTLTEQLLAHAGDEEAQQVLRAVESKHPRSARLHFNQAVLAERGGDTTRAILLFARLTKHPCARQKACTRLAALHARQGQLDRAAEYEKQAGRMPEDSRWPDDYWDELYSRDVGRQARYRELAGTRDDEAAYQQLLEMTSGEDTSDDKAHFALGKTLLRMGRRDEAERALRKALALEPKSVRVLYLLGAVLFQQAQEQREQKGDAAAIAARYEEAIALMRRAIEQKPGDADAHLVLGRALLARGRRAAAIEALRVPIATRPEDFRGYLFLGEALIEDGQFAEARKHLERAAVLAPADEPGPARALERLAGKK